MNLFAIGVDRTEECVYKVLKKVGRGSAPLIADEVASKYPNLIQDHCSRDELVESYLNFFVTQGRAKQDGMFYEAI